MGLQGELVAAMGEIKASFEPDELAYLTLTSKPEHAVRDRLAWRLQLRGHRVAREWARCDMAVFDGDRPVTLVELKATQTASVEWGLGGRKGIVPSEYGARTYFEALLRVDVAKMRRLAPEAEGFLLLVVTHVSDPVPRELRHLVKYGNELRVVADREKAEQILLAYLDPLGPVERVALGEGQAFGLGASVEAWLCGPVSYPEPALTVP